MTDEAPRTMEEAVRRLLAKMDKPSKDVVASTEEDDLILFHRTWGAGIRNAYRMWDNAALCESCGHEHPDSASMAIIREVWRRLRQGGESEGR
jgi:hypothetical protein